MSGQLETRVAALEQTADDVRVVLADILELLQQPGPGPEGSFREFIARRRARRTGGDE